MDGASFSLRLVEEEDNKGDWTASMPPTTDWTGYVP
jgi:hypothetical protein